jgi:hypothetical protein
MNLRKEIENERKTSQEFERLHVLVQENCRVTHKVANIKYP